MYCQDDIHNKGANERLVWEVNRLTNCPVPCLEGLKIDTQIRGTVPVGEGYVGVEVVKFVMIRMGAERRINPLLHKYIIRKKGLLTSTTSK